MRCPSPLSLALALGGIAAGAAPFVVLWRRASRSEDRARADTVLVITKLGEAYLRRLDAVHRELGGARAALRDRDDTIATLRGLVREAEAREREAASGGATESRTALTEQGAPR